MSVETQTEQTAAPNWFIDEGIPGVGNRPDWLPEKFKTAAHLGLSYAELEKKFGTVPEAYDVSKSKFIDPDYVPFQDFLTLAKEQRVSKQVIDKMVESLDKYMDEFTTDPKEELQKLGENAKERLTTLDNWAKANLSEDSYLALSGLKTASAIKALEELRGKMMSNNTVIPGGNDSAATNVASLDDLRTELSNNLDKFKKEPNYRKDLQSRMEQAAKGAAGSAYIDKSGA